MHADPVDKSSILNRQYESVYTRKDDGDIPCLDGQPYPSMPDIKVTKEGVEKLLKKINPSKACEPDMIPAWILRDMADEISPVLTLIFKKTLDLGELPEDWKSANVSPIFKKETDSRHQLPTCVDKLTSLCCKPHQ